MNFLLYDVKFIRSLRTSVLLTACEQDFISCVNISKRWLSEWMINEDKNPYNKIFVLYAIYKLFTFINFNRKFIISNPTKNSQGI